MITANEVVGFVVGGALICASYFGWIVLEFSDGRPRW